MRTHLVWAILTLAACNSGTRKDEAAPLGNVRSNRASVPRVDSASVLGTLGHSPPVLVVIDDTNGLHVAAVASLTELAQRDPLVGAKPATLFQVEHFVSEALGQNPKRAVADLDVTNREAEVERQQRLDDPPPPEEEDLPEDGADESGGTGTAMTLEEGKMGTRDSDRTEAQYRMARQPSEAELVERALSGVSGPLAEASLEDPSDPRRLARVVGALVDGPLTYQLALVLAAPRSKAATLVGVVTRTQAAIVVAHSSGFHPLRVRFTTHEGGNWQPKWLEARVSARGITIEAVPDAAIDVEWATGAVDATQLGAALDRARTSRRLDVRAPVDVLVDPDVDAQRLVDVLVALEAAGVRMIGLGLAPNPDQAARRGRRNPIVKIAGFNAQGDLDKPLIRTVVVQQQPKLRACYTAALASTPDLAGVITTSFFIKPTGSIANVQASGVDTNVAECVKRVFQAMAFPKPRGGGGVQVSFPLTLRP